MAWIVEGAESYYGKPVIVATEYEAKLLSRFLKDTMNLATTVEKLEQTNAN